MSFFFFFVVFLAAQHLIYVKKIVFVFLYNIYMFFFVFFVFFLVFQEDINWLNRSLEEK